MARKLSSRCYVCVNSGALMFAFLVNVITSGNITINELYAIEKQLLYANAGTPPGSRSFITQN